MKSFNLKNIGALLLTTSLSCTSAQADVHDPENVIETQFWGNLYANGGKTFYCDKAFTSKTPLMGESYVYSTSWIKDHLQCGTARQCKRESPKYLEILSDLHNIVPADSYFDFKRKTSSFGTVPESVEANECGIRKSFNVIEPANNIKGDIARIIVYMHTTYDLPLKQPINELIQWNELDPPSPEELERNKKIAEIQGQGNVYVEQPVLMENIRD